jgi:hypothetical protein
MSVFLSFNFLKTFFDVSFFFLLPLRSVFVVVVLLQKQGSVPSLVSANYNALQPSQYRSPEASQSQWSSLALSLPFPPFPSLSLSPPCSLPVLRSTLEAGSGWALDSWSLGCVIFEVLVLCFLRFNNIIAIIN